MSQPNATAAAALEALEVMAEPQRRRVFEHLQTSGPATVTDMVKALDMGRTLLAFHIGKLVDAGFVEPFTAEATPGRIGRPAQRYRLTGREVAASVPQRRYDLLADVLLDVLAQNSAGESAQVTAERVARRRGSELGAHLRTRGRSALSRLESLLSTLGYAPRRQDRSMQVLNCPFDRFRADHTPQVCAVNLALSEGYLDGLGITQHVRRPDAAPVDVLRHVQRNLTEEPSRLSRRHAGGSPPATVAHEIARAKDSSTTHRGPRLFRRPCIPGPAVHRDDGTDTSAPCA